jgi:hypothetical protein
MAKNDFRLVLYKSYYSNFLNDISGCGRFIVYG